MQESLEDLDTPQGQEIFLWLGLRKRHWTADRRHRHGLQANDNCYLCDQEPETIDHIIADCSFTRQIWWAALTTLQAVANDIGGASIEQWWESWRARWRGEKRKGADSLFAIIAWEVWKERNARCFRNAETTVPQLLSTVKHTTDLWIDAGARKLECLVRE